MQTFQNVSVHFLCSHISTTDMTTTAIPGIKTDWTESSASEESGEEIMITEFCSEPDAINEATKVPEPTPEPEKVSESSKHDRKKKKRKRSRSRSRDRHPKSYRIRDRHRSRSPRNHKHEKSKKEKEKQLPAAYALVR